tara:strand:- start:627 stop:881 length:255 start_codon:yes stop_codon:yes gene_type:complete
MKIIFVNLIIIIIKIYKFFISPLLGNNCRFNKTCSDYFIESLKNNGIFKGMLLGFKRILSCNPFVNISENEQLDNISKKGNKNG